MGRKFEKQNPKDKFIVEKLLPAMIEKMGEVNQNAADQIASMLIYPFKTAEGTQLGALKEPGVHWYFDMSGEANTGSPTYRIFDDSVMKVEQWQKFRQTFSDKRYFKEYSSDNVINGLLEEMSKETEYSENWWLRAYDIYSIWNPRQFTGNFYKATQNIDNNYFLFLDKQYPNDIKQELIDQGVLRDIFTETAKLCFWKRIPPEYKGKALDLLKRFGIPNSFINHSLYHADELNDYVKEYIIQLADTVDFPVVVNSANYNKCSLCHELIWSYIAKQSPTVLNELIQKYGCCVPLMNLNESFVPIEWDLFYSEKELSEKQENIQDKVEEEFQPKFRGDFEVLHINRQRYPASIMDGLCSVHEFNTVSEHFEAYKFGIEGQEIEFYKWLWRYSHSEDLVDNILYYYTGDDDSYRNTVPKSDVEFVLAVLKSEKCQDRGFCFDIDFVDTDYAFSKADQINQIAKNFEQVRCVTYPLAEKISAREYIPQIVSATASDSNVRTRISIDSLWDHVYVASDCNGQFQGQYLRTDLYSDGRYEGILLLSKSDDLNSYVRALATYVQEFYQTTVLITEAESFDWQREYFRLINDVRNFLSTSHEKINPNDIFGQTAKLNDVLDYGSEKRLWEHMTREKEKIFSCNTGKEPVATDNWRSFLDAKYKGRCQLCGGKTPTGEQKAHFWTFRIVKESENRLANLNSNLFCLCPSCHGEMRYGDFMGKNMSQLIDKAEMYASYFAEKLTSGELDDDFPPLIEELADDEIELEGFVRPIVCNVIVNGKDRAMAFSWEHFIKLSYILTVPNEE